MPKSSRLPGNPDKHPREYVRDGRAPVPKSELISRRMSSIRATDTAPELAVRSALISAGLGGYRLHWKRAAGKPDICYPGRKVAIFIHGCYWHKCPLCCPAMPRTHQDFWEAKFLRNAERDARKLRELRDSGWKPLVIWECQIKKDLRSCVQRVGKILRTQK